MNAIDMLKLDHRVVDALFQQAMGMQPSKRGPVYKKISNELAAHAHIEEAILYPKLLKEGNKDLKKIVLEGIEEHAQIHMFHDQLDTMKPGEEKFEPKLTVLQEDIRHHVKEEENDMFDMVKSQFSSEALEKLGEEMEAERTRFQKAKGIPKRTAAENILGQGMLTRMIDAVTGLFKPSGDESPSGKTRSNGKTSASTSRRSDSGSTSGKTASRGNGSSKSVASSSANSTSASGAKPNGKSTTSNAKSSKSSKTGSGATKSKSTASRSASKGSSAK